jgi:hypothetical protein
MKKVKKLTKKVKKLVETTSFTLGPNDAAVLIREDGKPECIIPTGDADGIMKGPGIVCAALAVLLTDDIRHGLERLELEAYAICGVG